MQKKVLFEAGPMLDRKKTGIGHYVDHLFQSLQARHGEQLELTGYYFNLFSRQSKNLGNSNLKFYMIWLMPGKVLSLLRRLKLQPYLEIFVQKKYDVVVFTNYVSLPQLRKTKTALIVYDLGYLDVPQYMQEVNRKYLDTFCSKSIQSADIIITISEFTKTRLKHHFPQLKANIVVTPIPPIRSSVSNVALQDSLIKMKVRPKGYILYLGTIEPRKNIENLLIAYSLLEKKIRDEYSLVIAGGKGWKDEAILSAVAQKRAQGHAIILTGYISDEQKAALYSNAACFILPSHYEGFGMPILEAMQYRTPTIVSDIPVFREVAEDAVLYFDKDNPQDVSNKLFEILTGKPLRESLIKRGNSRVRGYSWEKNADLVFDAFSK